MTLENAIESEIPFQSNKSVYRTFHFEFILHVSYQISVLLKIQYKRNNYTYSIILAIPVCTLRLLLKLSPIFLSLCLGISESSHPTPTLLFLLVGCMSTTHTNTVIILYTFTIESWRYFIFIYIYLDLIFLVSDWKKSVFFLLFRLCCLCEQQQYPNIMHYHICIAFFLEGKWENKKSYIVLMARKNTI